MIRSFELFSVLGHVISLLSVKRGGKSVVSQAEFEKSHLNLSGPEFAECPSPARMAVGESAVSGGEASAVNMFVVESLAMEHVAHAPAHHLNYHVHSTGERLLPSRLRGS